MRARPEDLASLLARYQPSQGSVAFPVIAAFVRVCEQLEPDLVWENEADRLDWQLHLGQLRFQLERWLSPAAELRNTSTTADFLQVLASLSTRSWRGPSVTKAPSFPFVRDSALRAVAERDYRSLEAAAKREDSKVVMVMSGSIIEAVLLDLVAHDAAATLAAANAVKVSRAARNPRVWGGFSPANPDSWSLIHLVGISGPEGLGRLSRRAEQTADTLRDWRNFVHPAKEVSETRASPLTGSDAIVARALADIVLLELAAPHPQGPTGPSSP